MADPYKQGQADAAAGKGARDENSFKTHQEKSKYMTGFNGK